ncbi:hypothetical protein RRG40_04390 [Mycoplasmopsis felis]|nr:hypothetical protein [Mycoplasmopsis felis]WQQ05334.1 hypothetical protein RRG59_03210 [Mycoplasmopsis felis]
MGNSGKAYNLIDGTDKNRFPAQTASYRENLAKIYPNGFNDNNFKTALFPEGFNYKEKNINFILYIKETKY